MELGIKDKVAVVTGGSKGIGKATALALACEGCRVCIVARTESTLQAAASEIKQVAGVEVMSVCGDVGDVGFLPRLNEAVLKQWGGIDILVNNSGGPPPGTFLEHNDDVWLRTLNENFLSAMRLTRAVAPAMKEKRWGRILCLTSTIAKEPTPQMVLSASARAAVSAFTKAVANELAPFNITVNTICPGGVQTERVENLMRASARRENKPFDEIVARSVAQIPLGRFATAAEIADVLVFFASQRASYVTGVTLMADGGLTKAIF